MIAIGGVIGAGLFVGSGVVINQTGPGAFLTYALCGVLIVMVMQMLGEMAVAKPSTGSFADYARDALGPWAGFSVAWLYWYFWVIVVGFEAVAGAKIITYWIDAPLWLLSLGLMLLMTATNLYSVRSFGEFEYWFAGIKVAAIVLFLVLGSLFVLGLLPDTSMDFSNLTAHGGFLPNGPSVLLSGIVIVVFSMVGAEIATIAGAESDDPKRAVTKATRSVVWRICLFFVGSLFLLAVILPWNSTELGQSPYVSAFETIGIPYAAHIMNAVVLTSVLSCLNSGLYTASRMLFVLAGRREAPPAVLRVNSRGVPTFAILMSTVVGFLCVLAAYVSPTKVFSFLLNSSGAVILFAYTLIAVSQFVLRRRADARGEKLQFRMWLFPWLTIATIVAMVGILISMGVRSDTRTQIILGLASWAFLMVIFRAIKGYREQVVEDDAQETPEPIKAHRLLVLANDDLPADALLRQVGALGSQRYVECYVCVPQNPVDAGTVKPLDPALMTQSTSAISTERLADMVRTLHEAGIPTEGSLGDFSPAVALDDAVAEFVPDSILIVRNSEDGKALLPDTLVHNARRTYTIPVYDVVGADGFPQLQIEMRRESVPQPRTDEVRLPADVNADA
jgi:GABA permease